jgi:hypothetical protein
LNYYREYVEVVPDDGSPPYTAEVRLCHDFPQMPATDSNRVVVFDERVLMSPEWQAADMPTETWAVLTA